jgi:feruloyl esterase
VTSAIQTGLSANPGYKLVVTGHSLGGGIAAIATSSFIGQGIDVAQTYTFGEPRNGNAAWSEYITAQISDSDYFRVTHSNDGVPQIPPTVLGYAHHGTEYFEREKSGNTAESTLDCGVDSTVCNNSSPRFFSTRIGLTPAQTCNAGQDFGSNPINGAHLSYGNTVIGSSLFIEACGAVFP